jgi:hypothetical protein
VDAVRLGIKQGLSIDEDEAKISSQTPYPKQPGTPRAEAELNRAIIDSK